MKIDRLTITGPDDTTSPEDLARLSAKYPFIEWGILFSLNTERPRYPTTSQIEAFVKADIPLSAHFCGWFPRSVLQDGNYELITKLPPQFKRVQLNYNFKNSAGYNIPKLLEYVKAHPERSIILQNNKSNKSTIMPLVEEDLPSNLHILYDASGGWGKEIERIDATVGKQYTGYAGGLKVDNIERICKMIVEDAEDATVWIDLESGARDENDRFDLHKVEQLAEITVKFI